MYATERKRQAAAAVGSIEDWLRELNTRVHVERLSEPNLARAAQLLNKTNQMNLATRRMTEAELWAWAHEPGHAVWTVRVSDRFGDMGLTGLVSVEPTDDGGRLVDYLLSCRVMGRRVEETMVALAVRHASAQGWPRLTAQLLPTEKNAPCLEFWKRSGFDHDAATDTFTWTSDKPYPFPELVEVTFAESGVTDPACTRS